MRSAALPRLAHALFLIACEASFSQSRRCPDHPDDAAGEAWLIALVATIGSVVGPDTASAGGIQGRPLLDFYGYSGQFEEFAAMAQRGGG